MKKLVLVLNVLMCVALIFCVVQINDLQNQVNNLRNAINSVDRNLSNDMSNIYQNVHDMLEEESNQLTVSDWEFGNLDVIERTAEIICTVVPKEYNPNTTKAKLISNSAEYMMDYADGKYTIKMNVPLFEMTEIEQVALVDNGTIRTQELDWEIQPRYEALIQAFASNSGEGRGTYGDDAYTWKTNSTIRINIEKKGTFEIKKIDLVEIMDGKEVNRIKVDLSNEAQREYADEISKKGESVPEYLYDKNREETNIYDGYAAFYYPLNKEIVVPNGSEYILYADIKDGYDLTYRCFIECISIKEDGKHDEEREEELRLYSFGEPIMIIAENGDVLFEVDEDLYK